MKGKRKGAAHSRRAHGMKGRHAAKKTTDSRQAGTEFIQAEPDAPVG
jgi:hypothetical protein